MGCRTNFCIGGGCVPTSTDVSAWMAAFGYQYIPADPLAQTYTNFVNNAPNGLSSQAAWKALCEASMRSRAVLFCNSSPGDVTVTNEGNLIGAVGSASVGATDVIGLIAGASSKALGAVTLGISDIFSAALSIIQAHAQAERAQANALSQLCPYATEAIQKADQAVFTGEATADQAISFLSSTFASIKQSWSSLEHSCNAFCWYNSVLDGILAASEILYGYAPAPAANNPDAVASGSGAAAYVPPITAIQAPLTSSVAAVPATAVSSGSGALILGIAVIVAVAIFAGSSR